MARPQTPDIRIEEALAPVAAPVNIGFAHPAAPAPSSLHGVAAALASLSGELTSVLGKKDAERKEADRLRGEAAFYDQNSAGIAEGVRRGEIPADWSKEYTQGYKSAMGAAGGFQLDTDVETEYNKWAGRHDASDPNAFNAWFSGTIKGKIGTDDPYILKGLLPHVRQVYNKFHDRWQKDATAATEARAKVGFGALIGTTIDAYVQEGKGSPDGPNLTTLGDTLDRIREKQVSIGMKREDIDALAIDAITTKAIQHRDERLLVLLDREGALGAKLKDTPAGRDAYIKASEAIARIRRQAESEAYTKAERENKQASDAAKLKITEALTKDPNAPIDETLIKEVERHDKAFRITIFNWQKTVREGTVAEDPRDIATLHSDILRGGGMEAITRALKDGTIKSSNSLREAVTFQKTIEEMRRTGSVGILNSNSAKAILSQIDTLGKDSKLSEAGMFGDAALTLDGLRARNDYVNGLIKWSIDHPNASPEELELEAQRLGQSILGAMGRGVDQGTYRPGGEAPAAAQPGAQGAPPQAPATPVAPPQGAPPAAPQAPQGQQPGGWQQRLIQSPSAPDIESLGMSREERARVNAGARQMGVTPQEFINRAWLKNRSGAGAPQPQQPPAPSNPFEQMRQQGAPGPRTSIELPGGIGQITLANLTSEQAEAVAEAFRQINLPDRIRGALSSLGYASSQTGDTSMVDSRRVQRIRNSHVGPIAERAARAAGFDPDKLMAIISIESGGRPSVSTGSYHGLLQLSHAEFSKYGNGGNIFDPQANIEAGIKSLQDKSRRFQREFGREPSAVELYLMHQQGEAGLRSHAKNPDRAAWQNMLATGEGRRKGAGWAKLAVWGNVPSDMRKYFGSVENVSSREFMAVWTAKMMGIPYNQALAMVRGGEASA